MTWLPAALDTRLAQDSDVGHVEYQVLRWLSRTPEQALHMSRLADTASVTPSHLSRIVARLEKRGMVSRTPDPADGRYTLARLTDLGARTVADTEDAYGAAVRDLVLARLTPEQLRGLGDAAATLLGHIKPECLAAHR
ncbi:MarR family transcriptional regulator [Cellulomonas triticagri]|uniref:MarR family transcriptional regulator n=2 Tax=Cellulomonas triticagri TaxID=2483352 RepID=A0A3M2J988_9CELL|nr:MarR family transcriptional regulator [Cellulomonas triticagri]